MVCYSPVSYPVYRHCFEGTLTFQVVASHQVFMLDTCLMTNDAQSVVLLTDNSVSQGLAQANAMHRQCTSALALGARHSSLIGVVARYVFAGSHFR